MAASQSPRSRSPGRLHAAALCGAAISLVLLSACNWRVPKPPTGPVPKNAMVRVPFPPPPARVETVPPKAKELDVWIDGQWDWTGRVWKWTAGYWMTPPPNAYFTPWTTERRADGQLYFARAAWRARDGRPLDIPTGPDTCPAPVPAAPVPPGEAAPKADEVAKR
jgi:hypothetical protein